MVTAGIPSMAQKKCDYTVRKIDDSQDATDTELPQACANRFLGSSRIPGDSSCRQSISRKDEQPSGGAESVSLVTLGLLSGEKRWVYCYHVRQRCAVLIEPPVVITSEKTRISTLRFFSRPPRV